MHGGKGDMLQVSNMEEGLVITIVMKYAGLLLCSTFTLSIQ